MSLSHEIHTSEIRSFLGCRRRWDWGYREGIVPEQSAKPLQFGIAFHVAMENFYHPETWHLTTPETKTQNAVDAFIKSCEEQRANYLKNTHQTTLLEADGDDYAERIDLGIGMIEWYGREVHPKEDHWFKPVMVEVPFSVPIKAPNGEPLLCAAGTVDGNRIGGPTEKRTCGQVHEYGAVVTFDGRIDAIMEDLFNGGYFIWDHKSAAQIRRDDRLLLLDPQVNNYTWAAYLELGIEVRGFLYVEYRKDFPHPPEPLKRSYKGRHFSTDKTAPTDLSIFTQTVQRYDQTGYASGVYDAYIAFLGSNDAPVFHRRFPIIKTKKNLESVGTTIYQIARDMISPNLTVYPNPGHFSCSGCAYYTPCLAKTVGEDYEHSLSGDPYKKVK